MKVNNDGPIPSSTGTVYVQESKQNGVSVFSVARCSVCGTNQDKAVLVLQGACAFAMYKQVRVCSTTSVL